MSNKLKIVLTGGGTAGSVMPLLAIYEGFKNRNIPAEFLFVGTEKGMEKELVKTYDINFKSISAGKLRRYLSLKNITDALKVAEGFFAARNILKQFKPQAVVSAGGFVAVPVIWAAYSLKIPCLIHQQDFEKGLANKLTQKPATKITVTFEKSLLEFPRKKVVLIGNPVRPEILRGIKEKAIKIFSLKKNLPTLLILGGGTGALKINQEINKILIDLVGFCQIIHLTGQGKGVTDFEHENYHPYELLTDKMKEALAVADLVISRAGLSTLTELAALAKPAIIIPIFKSHQEKNAAYFEKEHAVLVIRENILHHELLLTTIKGLLSNPNKLNELGQNIKKLDRPEALDKIIEIILEIKKPPF
ncbi:MAG: undecaprenyldiphospho-muramoylpentapeptide beta-N-acetylglucosaminyltransferase [Patescibacteria group bacterium]